VARLLDGSRCHLVWRQLRQPSAHSVRWGASSSERGAAPPQFSAHPRVLCPKGCMDQDFTWHGGRPRPRLHCVRWGPAPPPKKRAQQSLTDFSAHVYCDQTAGWIKMPLGTEVGLGHVHVVFYRTQPPSPQKSGTAALCSFRPMSIVIKRLNESRCH